MKSVTSKDGLLEQKGLPANLAAEKFVLGSIILDDSRLDQVATRLVADDFAIEKHRKIYRRMCEMRAREERIDRLTIVNELMRYGELESVDGLGYMISLDDGLPHISNIDSYTRIVRDKSALRRIITVSNHSMSRAILGEESAELILSDVQREMTDLSIATMDETRALNLRGAIDRTPGGVNAFLSAPARAFRMETGYPLLDEMMYGIQPKKVYVVAGDTSTGKSAWALNLAQSLTIAGHPGVYFTVEMSRDEMLQRMICARAEVSASRYTKGFCDQRERLALSAATNDIADLPLYLDDTPGLTAPDLIIQTRRAKQKWGIKWIVIDYIQILDWGTQPKGGRPLTEYEGLTAFSRAFKILAKTLDIAVIVLSQFSKNAERTSGKVRRPILSDLHGSGAMGKDADAVMFIWRPWLHIKQEEYRNHAELILAKHRAGPTGFVNLHFRGEYMRFYQAEDQSQKTLT